MDASIQGAPKAATSGRGMAADAVAHTDVRVPNCAAVEHRLKGSHRMPSASGAFYNVDGLTAAVRRQRPSSIKSDRYSVVVGCACGRPALYDGQVGETIHGGRCEGCSAALPTFAVVTRNQAAELREQGLVHTVTGQRRAHASAKERDDSVLHIVPGAEETGDKPSATRP